MDTRTPDEMWLIPLGEYATLNATILMTWATMVLLVVLSWLVTRRLTSGTDISPSQNLLEVIVDGIRKQVRDICDDDPTPYLPFVGTIFLFIAAANLLSLVPGYVSPTGSLSVTAALAVVVFFAVHLYGISARGWWAYLKSYAQPSVIMLPFNIIGELSRTLALSVRLFGNMMSGAMIVGILLSIAPLFFPIVVQLFGLLTGMIQAYIFAILSMVYIASAVRVHKEKELKSQSAPGGN